MKRRLPIWFFLLWLWSGSLYAVVFRDVSLHLIPPPSGKSYHGYSEYRLTLNNTSTTHARYVRVVFPKQPYHNSPLSRINLSATIPPGTQKRLYFWHPSLRVDGRDLQVTIDGYEWPDNIFLNPSEHCSDQGYSRKIPPVILVSQKTNAIVEDFPKPVKKGYYEEKDVEIIQADLPITDWSENWLGYSRYDGVFISGSEVLRLTLPQKVALEKYVEAGGLLWVLGDMKLPENWKRWTLWEEGKFQTYIGGFGMCFILGDSYSKSLTQSEVSFVLSEMNKRLPRLTGRKTAEDANRSFPVVKGVGVPVQGMLLLMLVYSILVGPVNIIFLNRYGKKIWLLWTVPVISVVTCGVVFLYAIYGEGFWGVRCRVAGVTYLNEETHRATSIAWLGLYSTLSRSEGLHFSPDAEVSPQIENLSYGRGNIFRSFDWSDDQHLDEGWLSARVPVHFQVRSTKDRLERVNFRNGPGGPTIVNGLGAKINRLELIDFTGKKYRAENVYPGKEAKLLSASNPHGNILREDDLVRGFNDDWLNFFSRIQGNSLDFNQKGRYIAVLDGAPFIEPGISTSFGDTKTTVIGILRKEQ